MVIEKFTIDRAVLFMENGLLHNINAPAFFHTDGTEEWYDHGLLHRSDGPAVLNINGVKEFWLNGFYQGKEYDGIFYPKD